MDWYLLFKLLHVLSAMGLVTGLVGRWIVNTRAAQSDLATMDALLAVSSPLEKIVVRSSFAVLVTGLLTALVGQLPLFGVLSGSNTNWILVAMVLFVLVLGVLPPMVFMPAGRVFEAAHDAARLAGAVTPELQAAFANQRVRTAHIIEIVGVLLIIALMVLKPF